MGQRAALLTGLTALCAAGMPALAAAYELQVGADPLAREIADTCSEAIAQQTAPTGDGWNASGPTAKEAPSANSDTRYADKVVDGVGNLHLSLDVSLLNGDRISHCAVIVMDPKREMPISDFGMTERLVGSVSETQAVWFSDDNKMIITAMSRTNPNGFLFSMDVIADAGQ